MSLLRNLRTTKPTTTPTPPPEAPKTEVAPTQPPPAPAKTGGSLLGRLPRAAPAPAPVAETPKQETGPATETPAAEPEMRYIPAREARAGHRYRLLFSTGPVDCTFICLSNGGYSFKLPFDRGTAKLPADAKVGILDEADETAILPTDAPQSGVSGPRAEGEQSEDERAATGADEDDEELDDAMAVLQEAAGRGVEPPAEEPKRSRGRPPSEVTKARDEEIKRKVAAGEGLDAKEQKRLEKLIEKGEVVLPTGDEDGQALPAPDPARKAESEKLLGQAAEKLVDLERAPRPEAIKTTPRESWPHAEAPAGVTLYVDAYPVKGNATNLEPHVRAVVAAICETYKVLDIRLGKPDSDLGYGKWKACLQVALKVSDTRPAPGAYYLLARGDEVLEVAAAALVEVADVAVVGR